MPRIGYILELPLGATNYRVSDLLAAENSNVFPVFHQISISVPDGSDTSVPANTDTVKLGGSPMSSTDYGIPLVIGVNHNEGSEGLPISLTDLYVRSESAGQRIIFSARH